jgi:hypothetical protein
MKSLFSDKTLFTGRRLVSDRKLQFFSLQNLRRHLSESGYTIGTEILPQKLITVGLVILVAECGLPGNQGDQIGRIFAKLLHKVAHIFMLLFS